jgi:hypothetical protein
MESNESQYLRYIIPVFKITGVRMLCFFPSQVKCDDHDDDDDYGDSNIIIISGSLFTC